MSEKLIKIAENFSSLLLVAVGLIGAIIGVADFAGWESSLLTSTKEPSALILITVGLLTFAVGLERIGLFRRYERRIEHIEGLIGGSLGMQSTVGPEEFFGVTKRLCSTAQDRIRTIAVGNSAVAPVDWVHAVASRLRESKVTGLPVKFVAVLIVDLDNIPSDFIEGIESRLKIYERYGVRGQVTVNILDLKPPIGFNFFSVDRMHSGIVLSTASGVRNPRQALIFENQPQVTTELVDWYEQAILQQAIPYEQWVETSTQR